MGCGIKSISVFQMLRLTTEIIVMFRVSPICDFTLFQLCFGLHQLLRETSGSLAVKCSTVFTSWSLTLSFCHSLLSRSCTIQSFLAENAMTVKHYSTVAAKLLNNDVKLTIKLCKAEGLCRFTRSFSVGSSRQTTPFTLSHCFHIVIRYIIIIKILIIVALRDKSNSSFFTCCPAEGYFCDLTDLLSLKDKMFARC